MKTRLSDKNIRRFYRLLSVRMIDFDCGELCAPKHGGIPYCCDNSGVVPVLFREEFKWQRKMDSFWKRMPVRTKVDRKLIDETCPHNILAECSGHKRCIRSRRSFICMTFPFEPHIGRDGEILGLAYIDDGHDGCVLLKKPQKIYNPAYIANSILFWQELFDVFPEEMELYAVESRGRERRAKKKGKKVRIFKQRNGKR